MCDALVQVDDVAHDEAQHAENEEPGRPREPVSPWGQPGHDQDQQNQVAQRVGDGDHHLPGPAAHLEQGLEPQHGHRRASGQTGHHAVEPDTQVPTSERRLGHESHTHDEGHVRQQVGEVAGDGAGERVQLLVMDHIDKIGHTVQPDADGHGAPGRPQLRLVPDAHDDGDDGQGRGHDCPPSRPRTTGSRSAGRRTRTATRGRPPPPGGDELPPKLRRLFPGSDRVHEELGELLQGERRSFGVETLLGDDVPGRPPAGCSRTPDRAVRAGAARWPRGALPR